MGALPVFRWRLAPDGYVIPALLDMCVPCAYPDPADSLRSA